MANDEMQEREGDRSESHPDPRPAGAPDPLTTAVAQQDFPGDPPPLSFVPDSAGETVRKSGLAWSAGIVFFGSVAFMLVLGWFADLLLGSAPWGLVVGIILGSLIGFMQFFRITSNIFPKQDSPTPPRTLMGSDDDR